MIYFLKRFAITFLLFIFCSAFYAKPVQWISPETHLTLQSGVTFETDKSLNLDSVPVNFSAQFDMTQFSIFAGFQVQPSIFDFTTYLCYAPTFFNHLSAGFKSLYHFKRYSAEYFENDFLEAFYLKYRINKYVAFDSDFAFHIKVTNIYSIEESLPWIKNYSFAFNFETLFNPIENLTIKSGVSSYTLYRYNLFFAPNYWLSAEYKFANLVSIGSKALVEYVDMYTLSANRRLFDFDVYVKLEL